MRREISLWGPCVSLIVSLPVTVFGDDGALKNWILLSLSGVLLEPFDLATGFKLF